MTQTIAKPRIKLPQAYAPAMQSTKRYIFAKGGRGSAKSHSVGSDLVVKAVTKYAQTGRGLRWACLREVQKTLKESAKRLIEDKIQAHGVGHLFDVQADRIITPGNGLFLFQGLKDHNAESIKSLEDFDGAWVEEAQTLTSRSNAILRPTIRGEGSQIIYSWNPTRKTDEVDQFELKLGDDEKTVVVMNWRDNPWFPKVLEQERQLDLRLYPERYEHIWEGAYATAFEGAYFADHLVRCGRECRILDFIAVDDLLSVYAFCDIGGAGAKADAYTMWIVQFVGERINVLDYYETVGQTLGYHAAWLRDNGWSKATIVLPHDGVNTNNITGKRYEDHWREAGFSALTVPNQGAGAAMQRVEAVRRVFSRIHFVKDKTEHGREALGYYHEKKDETRNIGLGPDHDWSSHAADAFGLMAIKSSELVSSMGADFSSYDTADFGAV